MDQMLVQYRNFSIKFWLKTAFHTFQNKILFLNCRTYVKDTCPDIKKHRI